jgi:DNA-binding transcriptional LysR family regulator
MIDIDPALLRALVVFADTGSLARVATVVGRTPSAVTAQLQRLEDIAGPALLQASGRGRVLTEAGERLVGYGRRMLAMQDEALASLGAARTQQRIGVGVTQDFADTGLPRLLRVFASHQPDLRIDLRVGRSTELAAALADQGIDVALTMRGAPNPDEVALLDDEMVWLAAEEGLIGGGDDVPLALFDPPCGFRDAALHALEQAGRRHRIAATSASLSGIRAAVRAGLAVTARTRRWLGAGVVLAPKHLDLPALGAAQFAVRLRPRSSDAARRLADLLAEGLRVP